MVAEEKPDLFDHRQQGRQLLEGHRDERQGQHGMHRQTDMVKGRKKERFQCWTRKTDQPQSGCRLVNFTESEFHFLVLSERGATE